MYDRFCVTIANDIIMHFEFFMNVFHARNSLGQGCPIKSNPGIGNTIFV